MEAKRLSLVLLHIAGYPACKVAIKKKKKVFASLTQTISKFIRELFRTIR